MKKFLLAATAAVALSAAPSSAHAWVHHYPMTKLVVVVAKGGAVVSSAMAGGIGFVGGLAAWCGANQPKRRNDTWTDNRHRIDYDGTYNARPDGCLVKPVQARG